MAMDSTTLYKLVILYMLKRVDYPLTNAQISSFFLEKGYTDYFRVQQCINSLKDIEQISEEKTGNTTFYHITANGLETLEYFGNRIPGPMIDDADTFLMNNQYELRSEVGTLSDCYHTLTGDYIVHCQVKEGDSTLIELKLAVSTKDEAEAMCSKWKENSQDIYQTILSKLAN